MTDAAAPASSQASLRWFIYSLLIALSLGQVAGRILAVNAVDKAALSSYLKSKDRPDWQKQRPFLSGNDRSRWATVRALVDQGHWYIDDVHHEPNWDTIDKVKHDGHYYSSKPPILAAIYAAVYWPYKQLTGKTLTDDTFEVVRTLLLLTHLPLLLIFLLIIARWAEAYGRTDFDRVFLVAAAALGTFQTTFAVVLNNHLWSAVCVAIALDAGLRIWYDGRRNSMWFFIAGMFAALATCFDLPALAFFGLLGLACLVKSPVRTLLAGVPAAALVFFVFFGLNRLAHETWVMPYAFRGETSWLNPKGEDWYRFEEELPNGRVIESYWSNPKGIDQGEPDAGTYVFHVLIGHHGIFSLTPIWCLTFLGLMFMVAGKDRQRALGYFIFTISLVVLAFYLSRDQIDRNYSGMSSAFRWCFWMIPLWLIAMRPAVAWLSESRLTIWIPILFLGLSVMAASYPTWNPWIQPIYYDWAVHEGWVEAM